MRVLIVPAAGEGSRFREAGYGAPKPFINLGNGQMMLERAVSPFLGEVDRVVPIFQLAHNADGWVESAMSHIGVRAAEHEVTVTYHLNAERTQGAALTVMSLLGQVPEDAEVVVINSDQFFCEKAVNRWFDDIEKHRPLGSMLLFNVPDRDPKWSYAQLNGFGEVVAVKEKQPISHFATCGAYYFRSFAEMRDGICGMVAEGDLTNNEYYLAPTYNYLGRGSIRSTFVAYPGEFMSVGTPELLVDWKGAMREGRTNT